MDRGSTKLVVPSGIENISRQQALLWVNKTLMASYSKIEQLHTGDAYCLFNNILFPNSIFLKQVKWNARTENECRDNWRLLQVDWERRGVTKPVSVDRLVMGKFLDNFEFLQWFMRFFKANYDGHSYNPINMRGGVELPSSEKFSVNRQRFPSMQLDRESVGFNQRPSLGFNQRPSVGFGSQANSRASAASPSAASRQSLGFPQTRPSLGGQFPLQYTPQVAQTPVTPAFNLSLNQLAREIDKVTEERDYYISKCQRVEQFCTENVGRVFVAARVLEILNDHAFSSSKGSTVKSQAMEM